MLVGDGDRHLLQTVHIGDPVHLHMQHVGGHLLVAIHTFKCTAVDSGQE
jgi:hypothetical protein